MRAIGIPAYSSGEPACPPAYESLRQALEKSIEALPEGRFIHAKKSGLLVTSSYRETLNKARHWAGALRRRGLRAGDGLIVSVEDSELFVPALWAAILAGAVSVPMVQAVDRNHTRERRWQLYTFAASALRNAQILAGDNANEDREGGTGPLPVLTLSDLDDGGGPIEGDDGARHGDDACLGVLTSGATGRPKLVGLNETALVARWWPKVPDAGEGAAFMTWSPFDHIMGLGHTAPNLACKIHLDAERFATSPLSWLDTLEQTQATHATMTNFGMSLVVNALEKAPEKGWQLRQVRKIGVGAERIDPSICRRFLNALQPFGLKSDAIILGYGLTECGPVVGGGVPFAPLEMDRSEGASIFLDRPTTGHEVRIVDDEGGIRCEGEVGHIEVRGPTMCLGYLNAPEETAKLITPDGWLRTGDQGLLRQGLLSVTGRIKEQIVVNAKKYSCTEIEGTLASQCDFQQIIAVPLPEQGGQKEAGKNAAIVVLTDEHLIEDVAGKIRSILAQTYKFAPYAVAVMAPEDIPRTGLGKVRRFALAEKVLDPLFRSQVQFLHDVQQKQSGENRRLSEVEREIAGIWSGLLKCGPDIDAQADFFVLGGDSILALQMSFLLEERFGARVPLDRFAESACLRDFARLICEQTQGEPGPSGKAGCPQGLPVWVDSRMADYLKPWPGEAIVKDGFIRRVGTATTGVPVFWCMQNEAEAANFGASVGARRPAYALRSGHLFLDYGSPLAEAFAARYAAEIRQAVPDGPLVIGGTCQGSIIALLLARQLLAEGRHVQLFVAANTNYSELFDGHSFPVPTLLLVADRSKFNPYRRFRYPGAGLKKLLPAGHLLRVISARYGGVMHGTAMSEIAQGLDEAILWAHRQSDTDTGIGGGYPDSAYTGAVTRAVLHLSLAPGQSTYVDAILRNDSPVAWAAFEESGIALGNHWLSPQGEVMVWSDGREPLSAAIEPGQEVVFGLEVTAPFKPGDYLLEVDLVEEGVRWFSEKNMQPLHIAVRVRDARTEARKGRAKQDRFSWRRPWPSRK